MKRQSGFAIFNLPTLLAVLAMTGVVGVLTLQEKMADNENVLRQQATTEMVRYVNALQACYDETRAWCAQAQLQADYLSEDGNSLMGGAIGQALNVNGTDLDVTFSAGNVEMAAALQRSLPNAVATGDIITFTVEPPTHSAMFGDNIQRYADTRLNRNQFEQDIDVNTKQLANVNRFAGSSGEFNRLNANTYNVNSMVVNDSLNLGATSIRFAPGEIGIEASDININNGTLNGDITRLDGEINGTNVLTSTESEIADLLSDEMVVQDASGTNLGYTSATVDQLNITDGNIEDGSFTSTTVEDATIGSGASDINTQTLTSVNQNSTNFTGDQLDVNDTVVGTLDSGISNLGDATATSFTVAGNLTGNETRTGDVTINGETNGREFSTTGDFTTGTASVNTNRLEIDTSQSEVNDNAAVIADNRLRTISNAGLIASNKTEINNNRTDSDAVRSGITSNNAGIATNAADISSNRLDIANNAASVSTNETAIAGNRAALTTQTNNINNNETGIAVNAAEATANQANIAVQENRINGNRSNIASNVSRISSAETNAQRNESDSQALLTAATNQQSQIATQSSRVTTNTNTISSNASSISANSARVNSNQTKSNTNAGSIASNNTRILNNQSAISGNSSATGANRTRISANDANIASNRSAVTNNRNRINTNVSRIAANTSRMNTTASGISTSASKLAETKGDLDNCMYVTQYCIPQTPSVSVSSPNSTQNASQSSFTSTINGSITNCRQGCSYSWSRSAGLSTVSGCTSGLVSQGSSASPTCRITRSGVAGSSTYNGFVRLNVSNINYPKSASATVNLSFTNPTPPLPSISMSCTNCTRSGFVTNFSAPISATISNCPIGCSYTWSISGAASESCANGNVIAGSSARPSCSITSNVPNETTHSGTLTLRVTPNGYSAQSRTDTENYLFENQTPNYSIANNLRFRCDSGMADASKPICSKWSMDISNGNVEVNEGVWPILNGVQSNSSGRWSIPECPNCSWSYRIVGYGDNELDAHGGATSQTACASIFGGGSSIRFAKSFPNREAYCGADIDFTVSGTVGGSFQSVTKRVFVGVGRYGL